MSALVSNLGLGLALALGRCECCCIHLAQRPHGRAECTTIVAWW